MSTYKEQDQLWGGLPLSSVRRVTAVLVDPIYGDEDKWLVDLLEHFDSLELLELRGNCGAVLKRLRHRMARGAMWVDIKTLIVRGGEYAKSQMVKLESVKDSLSLKNMTATHIYDPEARELEWDPDEESSGDGEVWSSSTDSDEEDSD